MKVFRTATAGQALACGRARPALSSVALVAALATALAACATPGPSPAAVELPEVTYISPGVADGVQDELRVPADIVPGEIPRVRSLLLVISSPDGEPLRRVLRSPWPPARGLFARESAADPAGAVLWDGRDDEGLLAADGEYRYRLEAQGRKGLLWGSPERRVVVDNTPPAVALSVAYPVFSPNGDGRLDRITISQRDSSEEHRWDGEVLNASGVTVRAFLWEGRLSEAQWDGTDERGSPLPDGEYSYRVRSTDLAGNAFSETLDGLVIDTRPSPVALDVDLRSFSPNGDGKLEYVRFSPRLQRTEGAQTWELDIYDEAGSSARTYRGGGVPPAAAVFDGRADSGRVLPDGEYFAIFRVSYANGDNPEAASPGFAIDTAPPRAALSTSYLLFSPDGDGRKDTLTIRQTSTIEKLWRAQILDAAGIPVRSDGWAGTRLEYVWDGEGEDGRRVPDGTYRYRLTATDEAENTEVFELGGIRVDTRPVSATVAAVVPSFSPNGDGVQDTIPLAVAATQTEEIASWSLQIQARDGSPLREFGSGEGEPVPPRLSWDGRSSDGRVVDGTYQAVLRVEYEKGHLAEARSGVFRLDTMGPSVTVHLSPRPFSPDGDGVDDLLTIRIEATDESPIEGWTVTILDPMEHDFAGFGGRGAPGTLTWGGRSSTGELVQSAEDYAIVAAVRDEVWNTTTVRVAAPVDVLVMREGDRLRIIISSIYFKPYTADFTDRKAIDPERVARNLRTLDRLAEILKKYREYRIGIEGHAVAIYWDQPAKASSEQAEVLVPLSLRRAEVIRRALIDRGVDGPRMSTRGWGGAVPVVPHGDLENRWKNRRVEFLLVK